MKISESIQRIRSQGTLIDLWPSGKSGVEAKIFLSEPAGTAWIFVYGTNSAFDWLIHFLPGWGDFIEISYALALASRIQDLIKKHSLERLYLYGHSWGGAIVALTHEELLCSYPYIEISTTGLGYKKPIAGMLNRSFRNRGDIVPLLTPWRKGKLYEKKLFGTWKPFWIAHSLDEYIQNLRDLEEIDLTKES